MHRRSSRRFTSAAPVALCQTLEPRTLLSTFYVSSSLGDDHNSGTSMSSPWKTIAKVNTVAFHPGDFVLFKGGDTFTGGRIKPIAGGSPTGQIVFGSYGNGRAIISSGKADGAFVGNGSGIWFQDLKFVGTPNGLSHDGIHFEINVPVAQANIRVDNCEISGYGESGIHLFTTQNSSNSSGSYFGYSNVRFTNNSIHDNNDSGIFITAPVRNLHTNVYIGHNDVFNSSGDPSNTVTGSGMELAGLNGATIERNTTHNNGYKSGKGGAGIWTFASNNVLIQFNESYGNRAPGGPDGDGIDFDADTQNSIMQFNYSHDNDGAGLMMDQWKGNTLFTHDTIRYNVSRNNALHTRYADISVFGQVQASWIYSNVAYSAVGSDAPALRIQFSKLGGSYVMGLHLANNAIVTTGGRKLIDIEADEIHGSNLTFTANAYWASGSTAKFAFGNTTYSSLSSWQSATGEEKLNGKAVGVFARPQLVAADQSGALGADNLDGLAGFRVTNSSPLIDHGIDVSSLYGAPSVSKDYFGNPVPEDGGYDIGVDELSLPSGWTSQDVGSVARSGTGQFNRTTSTYTVVGSGSDIFGSVDSFHFASTTMTGDGSIVAKITSLTAAAAFAKAGVMIRNSDASNAAQVSLMLNENTSVQFLRRTSGGASTSDTKTNSSGAPLWLKLVRSGNTFSASTSTDGSNWHLVGTATVTLNQTVDVGLAVTAHDNGAMATADFTNVSVTH
jgi:regulation of enolase protein 1 (concanavalin A-like superfamily)